MSFEYVTLSKSATHHHHHHHHYHCFISSKKSHYLNMIHVYNQVIETKLKRNKIASKKPILYIYL